MEPPRSTAAQQQTEHKSPLLYLLRGLVTSDYCLLFISGTHSVKG
jgi:hypothetical protein